MTTFLPGRLRLKVGATPPGTPATGEVALYSADGTALLWKDDTGTVRTIGGGTKTSALPAASALTGSEVFPAVQGSTNVKVTTAQINAYADPISNTLVAAQGPSFASDTYVNNSVIALPGSARQAAGMVYRCVIGVTKTNAGTAAPVVNVRVGTAGTTTDTSRGTLTSPSLGTAVADEGLIEIYSTFRVVGASAVLQSMMRFSHGLASTGFLVVPAVVVKATSGTFDSLVASGKIGVSLNGGASAAWTVHTVQSHLLNLL